MKSITCKYVSKTLALILLTGTIYSCSKIDNDPVPVPGEGDPVELSISLNASTDKEKSRASENPNDYNQEKQIHSLEVFIFKPSGELDGYEFIAPKVKDGVTQAPGKYYDKEYVHVDEVKNIHLSAGERHIYVIANPPLKDYGTAPKSILYEKLPTNPVPPKENTGSLTAFRNTYAELEDQGYITPPAGSTKFEDGSPIGGLDPTGYQSTLTMTAYRYEKFDNQKTKHYLGYPTSTGKPGGAALDATEKALTTGTSFQVERLVARVMLQEVIFPTGPLKLEGSGNQDITEYTASLDSVYMVNVQSQARFWNDVALTGQYVHGYDHGYKFLQSKLGSGSIPAGSNEFKPALPKSKLVEEATGTAYKVDASGLNSSPIWFYAFANNAPTYLVLGVKYNFKSKLGPGNKTVKYYYPAIVNPPGNSGHNYIQKNYQYAITFKINSIASAWTSGPKDLTRAMEDINWDEVMTVEQEVGENLFPWTGNKYINE